MPVRTQQQDFEIAELLRNNTGNTPCCLWFSFPSVFTSGYPQHLVGFKISPQRIWAFRRISPFVWRDYSRQRMQVQTGRFERRMAKAEVIELLHLGESPTPKVEAITENVSPSGVRVITNSMCAPGELLRLGAPKDHLSLSARVVYCQRVRKANLLLALNLPCALRSGKSHRGLDAVRGCCSPSFLRSSSSNCIAGIATNGRLFSLD